MNLSADTRKCRETLPGVCLATALLLSPVLKARSDSITTDGDIVSDGVSLQALKDSYCQHLDELHSVSPLPPICALGSGERFISATSTTSTAGGDIVQWANNLLNPSTFTEGLAAGDAICQKHADDAGLVGTYRAWLSTDSVDARDRIGDHAYKNSGGTVVASSKAQLLSCTFGGPSCLTNAILNENGATPPPDTWTGTLEDGTNDLSGGQPVAHCDNWTKSDAITNGWTGDTTNTNARWTARAAIACTAAQAVYCLQL